MLQSVGAVSYLNSEPQLASILTTTNVMSELHISTKFKTTKSSANFSINKILSFSQLRTNPDSQKCQPRKTASEVHDPRSDLQHFQQVSQLGFLIRTSINLVINQRTKFAFKIEMAMLDLTDPCTFRSVWLNLRSRLGLELLLLPLLIPFLWSSSLLPISTPFSGAAAVYSFLLLFFYVPPPLFSFMFYK